MLFDKLKALLSRHPVSEETLNIVTKAKSTRELLHGLDALHTRNEMEFNEVTREIENLEGIETGEMERVRGGTLSDRRKKNALLKIRRLRKQMENLDNRLKIYDHNMSLHLNLIGKVQEMEAMSMRGISETEIDKILIDFEEKLEGYMGSLASAKVVEDTSLIPDVASEMELAEIESDVMREPSRVEKRHVAEAPGESIEELEQKAMRSTPQPEPAEAEAEEEAEPEEAAPPRRLETE